MRRPAELPDPFGREPFAVAAALAAGVTRRRLRAGDLQAPFFGVRSVVPEQTTLIDRCRAYAVRMRPDHAFSHLSAAQLWRIPLPVAAMSPGELHVLAPFPARAPEGRGIIGRQAALGPNDITELSGIRLVKPAVAWCQLAESFALPDVVAAAEWLVTGNAFDNVMPLVTIDDLVAATDARRRRRGHVMCAAALPLVRDGALSRPESLLRLLLVAAGLPEPLINQPCYDALGSFLAMPDLCWPTFRVVVEYQGDHHRIPSQFRRDIQRLERLADHGWTVVQVSADDLFGRPDETITRVARRLTAGGWNGSARAGRVVRFTR